MSTMLWLSVCVLWELIVCATATTCSLFRGGLGPASSESGFGELDLSLSAFMKLLQAAAPLEERGIAESSIIPRKYDIYTEVGGALFL